MIGYKSIGISVLLLLLYSSLLWCYVDW